MSAIASDEKYADFCLPPPYEDIPDSPEQEVLSQERRRLIAAVSELEQLRAEMEAKVRAEMEEKYKAEEAKRALEAAKTERHEMVMTEFVRVWSSYNTDNYFSNTKEFLVANRVLYWSQGFVPESHRSSNSISEKSSYFATEQYFGIRLYCSSKNGGAPHAQVHPLYHFDQPLTLRDLKILDQLINRACCSTSRHPVTGEEVRTYIGSYCYIAASVYTRFGEIFHNAVSYDSTLRHAVSSGLMTTFDSVLRLIPGSYRNGPWRPLDGLLGVYFNEETAELHVGPPAN